MLFVLPSGISWMWTRVTPLFSCTHRSPRCWKHWMTWAKTALTFQWKGPFSSGYQLLFPSTAPSRCLTGWTTVTPRALQILLLPKEVCFIKGKKKKWIITTVWKHKTSFSPNYLMAGVGFFVLFPLAEELFRNTWSEKQIVLGVPAQPWEDLIWFPAPNEAENRPERCVCDDLPLDHPAAEQTDGILPHKFLALHTKGFS